jgi:hypothetical protein
MNSTFLLTHTKEKTQFFFSEFRKRLNNCTLHCWLFMVVHRMNKGMESFPKEHSYFHDPPFLRGIFSIFGLSWCKLSQTSHEKKL